MIVQKDLFSLEFYKKTHYTGSEGNMRFRIEKVEVPESTYDPITGIVVPPEESEDAAAEDSSDAEDTEPVKMVKLLMATIWKGPYAFATTQEPKISHWAEFTDEGMTKLVEWMEQESPKYQAE